MPPLTINLYPYVCYINIHPRYDGFFNVCCTNSIWSVWFRIPLRKDIRPVMKSKHSWKTQSSGRGRARISSAKSRALPSPPFYLCGGERDTDGARRGLIIFNLPQRTDGRATFSLVLMCLRPAARPIPGEIYPNLSPHRSREPTGPDSFLGS